MSTSTFFMIYPALIIFAWATAANYLSITLHRGIAHRAVKLPLWWIYSITVFCNLFVLYLNPRTWVADHRMHHAHSDGELDPDKKPEHTTYLPWLFYILTHRPSANDPQIVKMTGDPIFKSPLMRAFSSLPGSIICEISCLVMPMLIFWSVSQGLILWGTIRVLGIGVLSFQSYLGHGHHLGVGYRNYEAEDHSVNLSHPLPLILTAGECLQNNHHVKPRRASHAHTETEWDVGFFFVRILAWLRIAEIPNQPPLNVPTQTTEATSS